jgi:hypothetical protein
MEAIRTGWLFRRRVPLVVRGRCERTFFGLGAFAAVILLLGGVYLLRETWLDPLGASDVRVLVGGVALALSSFLIVFLMWPFSRIALAKRDRRSHSAKQWNASALTVYGKTVQDRMAARRALEERKDLPGPM